ncbi:MAG TPA: hypothetical protein VHN78_11565, partial [Chloroflexota bacterium]|nr:hypothetical protein [Chloroflexota bacterium]
MASVGLGRQRLNAAWRRARRRPTVTVALIILAVALLVLATFFTVSQLHQLAEGPARQAALLREQMGRASDQSAGDRITLEKDLLQYAQARTDNWIRIGTTLVQFVGVLVLAAGGYFL